MKGGRGGGGVSILWSDFTKNLFFYNSWPPEVQKIMPTWHKRRLYLEKRENVEILSKPWAVIPIPIFICLVFLTGESVPKMLQ